MSKRIKIALLSAVIVIVAAAAYFTLTYQLKEAWLRDYLYEVYGGEQWVKVGEDGKYYAYRAAFPEVTYEDGIFKADKTSEFCLQPERNYYEGDDIFITTDKAAYKYGEEIIRFTITNNSAKTIWPIGLISYDIEINIDGKWYAIYLSGAFSDDLRSYRDLSPGDTLEDGIPIYIMGFPDFDIYKSGLIYTAPNYFKLRPGLYRLVHRISLLPQDEGYDTTYISCTFKIK